MLTGVLILLANLQLKLLNVNKLLVLPICQFVKFTFDTNMCQILTFDTNSEDLLKSCIQLTFHRIIIDGALNKQLPGTWVQKEPLAERILRTTI